MPESSKGKLLLRWYHDLLKIRPYEAHNKIHFKMIHLSFQFLFQEDVDKKVQGLPKSRQMEMKIV